MGHHVVIKIKHGGLDMATQSINNPAAVSGGLDHGVWGKVKSVFASIADNDLVSIYFGSLGTITSLEPGVRAGRTVQENTGRDADLMGL